MKFKRLTIEDKPIIDGYLKHQQSLSYMNDFATLYCWNVVNKAEYAILDGETLIYRTEWNGKEYYFVPMSLNNDCDLTAYIKEISELDNSEKNFAVVTEDKLKFFEPLDGVTVAETRDSFDYIYLSTDLIHLSGKKFHAKRNHINKFTSMYNHSVRGYTNQDREAVSVLYDEWSKESGVDSKAERTAFFKALDNFDELQLKGTVIEINGNIVAFSVISINHLNMAQVQFEKALNTYSGIYAAINNYAAKLHCASCKYINRQEDMGIEGLRKSKLSYNPEILLKKYNVNIKV